jgi:DNA-binding winged helix-turn-helix (wHTH) protein/tetratricopeptide (TPR) repeat protein
MESASTTATRVRFAVFEVDLQTGELRKAGVRVALQEQPFRILVRLLEQPGELVTREQLRQELWPDDTFVSFDHGLNAAIKRLRDALGDSAATPRFIETLPRRGYRFIAPLGSGTKPDPPAVMQSRMHWLGLARRPLSVVLAAAALATAIGGATMLRWRPRTPFQVTPILVSDFNNRTREDVFDGTLREALTVAFQQSPAFAVVSRERVLEVLREMTAPLDVAVVGDLALEACQRSGARVTVGGTISVLGTRYVISLAALNCATKETLATVQTQADGRARVLDALGDAASRLRRRLGESRATIERFDAPLRDATTKSLEALRAFNVGEETRERKGDLEAEPFYLESIQYDPDFALAYARLSSVYANSDRHEQMRRATAEAFARRSRVTPRERFYIDYRYCAAAMSEDPECMLTVPELWKRAYPVDWGPHQAISYWHAVRSGNFAAAVDEALAAVRLEPNHYLAHDTLAAAYEGQNRLDDARLVVETALSRHPDASLLHEHRFRLAFGLGDRTAMESEREWASGKPGEPLVMHDEAETVAFEGRLNDWRALRDRAELGAGPRLGSWSTNARARDALFEAAVGAIDRVTLVSGDDVPWMLPIAAALLSHRLSSAEALLDECRCETGALANDPPFAAPARVLLAVERGHRDAIRQLRAPAARELTFRWAYVPAYLRGLAFLHGGDAARASEEFQRILDHRGLDLTSILYPLAYVHQARAYALMGEAAKARAVYERFLDLWRHADADVPILIEARTEYSKLLDR